MAIFEIDRREKTDREQSEEYIKINLDGVCEKCDNGTQAQPDWSHASSLYADTGVRG